MRIHRPLLLASILGMSLSAAVAQAQPPPTPVDAASIEAKDKARDLYRAGLEAFQRRDWRSAYLSFSAAWLLYRNYQIAGNLGACEMKLKSYRDAAEHLTFFLRELPRGETPDSRAAAEADLATAKAKVGAIRVSVDQDDSVVALDGKVVGRTPLADPLYVEPGHHVIEARHQGFITSHHEIDASAGATYEVNSFLLSVVLEEPAPVPALAPPPPNADEAALASPPAGRRSMAPVVVGGVLAATAIGVGVGLEIASNAKGSEAGTLYTQLGALAPGYSFCYSPPSAYVAECAALKNDRVAHDLDGNAALTTFIAGGALAVATGVYFLWPQKKGASARSRSLDVAPAIGRTTAGLSFAGSW
jgi:hypothetical protein